MMTQSVMTPTASLFGNAVVSVTAKGKQSAGGFDLFIDSSMKNQNPVEKTDSSDKKTLEKNTDRSENSISDVDNQTEEQTEAGKVNKGETTKESASTEQANRQQVNKDDVSTDAAKDQQDEEAITDAQETIAQLMQMLASIRQAVMDTLNLSAEEFDRLMIQEGMELQDLLQSDGLQKLLLAADGEADIMTLLTDEKLADAMKQLLLQVEDIKAEADLGLTDEQIRSILKQNVAQEELSFDTVAETVADNMRQAGQTENSEQTQELLIRDSKEEDKLTSSEMKADQTQEAASLTKMDESSNTKEHADSESSDDKDLKAADQFQAFIDNLVKNSGETRVDFNANLTQSYELREIANQIIERIRVQVTADHASMELQLNPEHLGKVNLSVQAKNGMMTAQFVVENEISKEAIESQLQTLRNTLNEQGIKVEAIEVTVSSHTFEQNDNETSKETAGEDRGHNSKKITLEEALNMTELSEEDGLAQDITGVRGSLVDYTA